MVINSSFFVLQYQVMVYLGITLTLCSFIQPYKKYFHNCMDLMLNTNALILLIIRNVGEIESPTSTGNISFDLTANCDDYYTNTIFSPVNYRLFPFYYFPIVVFFISSIVALVMAIKR